MPGKLIENLDLSLTGNQWSFENGSEQVMSEVHCGEWQEQATCRRDT